MFFLRVDFWIEAREWVVLFEGRGTVLLWVVRMARRLIARCRRRVLSGKKFCFTLFSKYLEGGGWGGDDELGWEVGRYRCRLCWSVFCLAGW